MVLGVVEESLLFSVVLFLKGISTAFGLYREKPPSLSLHPSTQEAREYKEGNACTDTERGKKHQNT